MSRTTKNLFVMGIVAAVASLTLVACVESHAALITDTTDFESGTSVFTDGYLPGWGTPNSISGPGDTADGWTWYTSTSTTNTISVPLSAGGTTTVGEQVIRVGSGLELQSNDFKLGWGTTNTVALRSQTYSVDAGFASIDWTQSAGGTLNAYYSQDSGTTWSTATPGASFATTAGTVQFLIARNAGLDQNPAGPQSPGAQGR